MFGRLLKQGNILQAGLLLSSYLVMVCAAVWGSVPFFAGTVLVAIAGEVVMTARSSGTLDVLEKIGVGRLYRHLARDLALVLLLVQSADLSPGQLSAVLLVLAGVWAAAIVSGAAVVMINRRYPGQVLIRNIELGSVQPPPRPSAWSVRLSGDRLPYANTLVALGALVSVVDASVTALVLTSAAALAVAAVILVTLAVTLLRSLMVPQDSVPSAVRKWFAEYRPQVALYSAGPAKDVYQVNMWLEPMAALEQRSVVLLRNAEAFEQLAATHLPVVCVPSSVEFMNMNLDSIRVALYPANVGANIHLLREPGMKHVFVGHGDSDKQASANPYSKVYDEVWVAGSAGRERYARAAVGVEDRDIVEIGRPQLAGLERFASASSQRPFTVLYAPTWEGWLADQHHTSLVLMGESLVRGLLGLSPAVRLIYKPHPLTGSRCTKARAVHERVTELIRAAGGQLDATSLEGAAHRVVTGSTPSLFDCFNASDILISDVSSVVSDFIQTQRPYVVANPDNLPEDEFRQKYPTARAAYLLSADCGELEKIVDLARRGDDPMSEDRRELKNYLLGPDEPSPLNRFCAEVRRLAGGNS